MASLLTPHPAHLSEHTRFVPAVAELVQGEWGEFSGRTAQQTIDRFTGERLGFLPTTLVLAQGDRLLGLGSLRTRDSMDWDPDVGPWICNVIVAPIARGQGLGPLIVNGLVAEAREHGFDQVYLACGPRPEAMYRRLGFESYANVEHDNDPQTLMVRATTRSHVA